MDTEFLFPEREARGPVVLAVVLGAAGLLLVTIAIANQPVPRPSMPRPGGSTAAEPPSEEAVPPSPQTQPGHSLPTSADLSRALRRQLHEASGWTERLEVLAMWEGIIAEVCPGLRYAWEVEAEAAVAEGWAAVESEAMTPGEMATALRDLAGWSETHGIEHMAPPLRARAGEIEGAGDD